MCGCERGVSHLVGPRVEQLPHLGGAAEEEGARVDALLARRRVEGQADGGHNRPIAPVQAHTTEELAKGSEGACHPLVDLRVHEVVDVGILVGEYGLEEASRGDPVLVGAGRFDEIATWVQRDVDVAMGGRVRLPHLDAGLDGRSVRARVDRYDANRGHLLAEGHLVQSPADQGLLLGLEVARRPLSVTGVDAHRVQVDIRLGVVNFE